MKKLFFFAFLLSFSACTIYETAPGPQGPPGPAGAPGNANVVSTEAIALNTWFYNSQYNWYATTINMPEITTDVVNNGLVMVYQRLTNGPNPTWIPLPDTYANVTTNYDFNVGSLNVYSFKVDNTTPIAPTGMIVRVVVVPSAFKKANPDTNWKNFEEAKAVLKLQD